MRDTTPCWMLLWGAALALLAGQAMAQPQPLRGVQLMDHHGQALSAAGLAGRPVLLHFVFTVCSTTCPLQVRELAAVHGQLPADVRQQLRVVSVSVDPLSDTPQTLANFARRLDADRPGWHFATGHPVQVHKLLDRLQVMNPAVAQPRPEDHRTSLYLFGADGALVQRYRGVPVDQPRLLEEINRLVRPAPLARR